MHTIDDVMLAMIQYDCNDPKRIQHFIKVYTFASLIGRKEMLDEKTQRILELSALVHDIGIKIAEEKYQTCNGKLQEQEGPNEARNLLNLCKVKEDEIERIAYLVGHHHTYDAIDGLDYQILVEADFLVNCYEDALQKDAIYKTRERIFKTKAGIEILDEMFGL